MIKDAPQILLVVGIIMLLFSGRKDTFARILGLILIAASFIIADVDSGVIYSIAKTIKRIFT